MTLDITDKLKNESRRLLKHLASGVVPVNDVRDFFSELNKQIDQQSNGTPRKRNAVKATRKDHYKNRISC